MKRIEQTFDLVVAGGGLAGVCAAIAAARGGLRTCLVHERPVLGGVASSEMRVTVHGCACHHVYGREAGIVQELLAEERLRNHEPINENGWTNSVFDQVLYDACQREPGLTLHLNSPVVEAIMEGGEPARREPETTRGYDHRPTCTTGRRIEAVVARTLSAEVELVLRAAVFVDATGDAFLADRAGCEWRMGTESRAEFGEPHAPETASPDTMGSSIHIRAKDIGREAPFAAPDWAVRYEDAAFFYQQGRPPTDPRGGFWWIEIGVPWHTIHDNETIRHELTRHALGVWDWMKNRDATMRERCRNFALDFIGQVPGKRESRRVAGRHWITEVELLERTRYPDEVAFGGWFVDLHTPGGLLAPTSEPLAALDFRADSEYGAKSYIGPYGIPLRALMARDVDNLFLAGRCLSCTHAALGTLRVMGTTALMGQAVGAAAALAARHRVDVPRLAEDAALGGPLIRELQQDLLRQGCFLPNHANADSADIARHSRVTASGAARFHGQSPHDADHRRGQVYPQMLPRLTLAKTQGQILFLDGGPVRCLSLCCDHDGETPCDLHLRLVRIEQIWDYRLGGAGTVAETVVSVAPGRERWVDWPIALVEVPAGIYRLEATGGEALRWVGVHHMQPGHTAQYQISPTRMRDRHCGHAVRIEPPQACYGPDQVLSGVCRPQRAMNCWRGDPAAGFPQWLELAWDAPQTVAVVELSFAGHLFAEVHIEPPFWRDPQTVRDYRIEIPDREDWRTVLEVTGNHQRHRRHVLERPVTANRLRLLVTATNGDPSACVYEVRCYA